MQDQEPRSEMGRRGLIAAGATVLVVAGLKFAAPVFLPIVVAAVTAVTFARPLQWLQARGLPTALALTLIVVFLVAVGGAVMLLLVDQVDDLVGSAERYERRVKRVVENISRDLEHWGIEVDNPDDVGRGARRVVRFVGSLAGDVFGLISGGFLVLLLTIFMLAEANGFSRKVDRAFPDTHRDVKALAQIADQIYDYVFLKTQLALATGILFGGCLALIGVEFAFLWGLTAFLFSFIPTIGGVLSLVPPAALAILDGSDTGNYTAAVLVVLSNLGISQLIGTVIEPRLMGKRMGLSPLVVFVALLVWGWIWGPIGVLLSTPLTMALKIVTDNVPDLRWMAVLLGPVEPAAAEDG